MTIERFDKPDKDTYPVIITYTNDDGVTTYEIASVLVEAFDASGNDVTSTVTNPSKLEFEDNKAKPWVRGGDDGEIYTIEVTATMLTEEKLTKTLVMTIKND